MLKFERGNYFQELDKNEILFVTSNALLKKNNELFLSKGAGIGALRRCPGVDYPLGNLIRKYGVIEKNDRGNDFYRFGCVYSPEHKMGAFQIKYHMNDQPSLDLINHSSIMLAGFCRGLQTGQQVHLNFPGLGNNQQDRPELYKILERNLKNSAVTFWRLPNVEVYDNDDYEDEQDNN